MHVRINEDKQNITAKLDEADLSYKEYDSYYMIDEALCVYFEDDICALIIYHFFGETGKDYLPHGVTLNEYLERLDPSELQRVQQKQVYELIRRKSFDGARFRKKHLVIVDGTQTYSGSQKLNESCLERHYNKGTEEERLNYHCDVLEAKIVFGESLIVSIASEFIENNGEDAEAQREMSEEKRKQDCETKAFKRLSKKLKEAFPRLPAIILGDSLHASEPVMDICWDNKWDFIIRYKSGSIPSITEEYENIAEKGTAGHAEFVNGIDYNVKPVNMLRYWEDRIERGETVQKELNISSDLLKSLGGQTQPEDIYREPGEPALS